jgi:hypothetical protein
LTPGTLLGFVGLSYCYTTVGGLYKLTHPVDPPIV